MPLKHYGVLKGRAIASRLGAGQSPHYQVHLVDDTTHYRIAINVKSKLSPSDLGYLVDESFSHPVTEFMRSLDLGFHELASSPNSGSIDFIRGNLFDPMNVKPLPFNVPGPDNDLNEKIDAFVSRAIDDELATMYAFGERWGPEPNKSDKHFGFLPGNGIHDIHMNQGNSARFKGDNGVWQDGALLMHFPEIRRNDEVVFGEQWVGVFLAFQSQVWHTHDTTGHALPGFAPGLPGTVTEPPNQGEGDGRVRIVAALVNPRGHDPGLETVTIINTTPDPIELNGWSIADKHKQTSAIGNQSIDAGQAKAVSLFGDGAQLANKGGIITLLDPAGVKVHGVSYTRDEARAQGRTIVF
jgi:uncharacterized protein YukJ